MTLDIETFDDNNIKKIYCICIFDGKDTKSFYLTDYININSLIKYLLRTIFSKNYSGKHIYIHNSSEFDLIFLLRYIAEHPNTKIEPIIKDGKFINLRIKYGPLIIFYFIVIVFVNLKNFDFHVLFLFIINYMF